MRQAGTVRGRWARSNASRHDWAARGAFSDGSFHASPEVREQY